jgi:hypothetical protein
VGVYRISIDEGGSWQHTTAQGDSEAMFVGDTPSGKLEVWHATAKRNVFWWSRLKVSCAHHRNVVGQTTDGLDPTRTEGHAQSMGKPWDRFNEFDLIA